MFATSCLDLMASSLVGIDHEEGVRAARVLQAIPRLYCHGIDSSLRDAMKPAIKHIQARIGRVIVDGLDGTMTRNRALEVTQASAALTMVEFVMTLYWCLKGNHLAPPQEYLAALSDVIDCPELTRTMTVYSSGPVRVALEMLDIVGIHHDHIPPWVTDDPCSPGRGIYVLGSRGELAPTASLGPAFDALALLSATRDVVRVGGVGSEWLAWYCGNVRRAVSRGGASILRPTGLLADVCLRSEYIPNPKRAWEAVAAEATRMRWSFSHEPGQCIFCCGSHDPHDHERGMPTPDAVGCEDCGAPVQHVHDRTCRSCSLANAVSAAEAGDPVGIELLRINAVSAADAGDPVGIELLRLTTHRRPCPECRGFGYDMHTEDKALLERHELTREPRAVTCATCRGKGHIEDLAPSGPRE